MLRLHQLVLSVLDERTLFSSEDKNKFIFKQKIIRDQDESQIHHP